MLLNRCQSFCWYLITLGCLTPCMRTVRKFLFHNSSPMSCEACRQNRLQLNEGKLHFVWMFWQTLLAGATCHKKGEPALPLVVAPARRTCKATFPWYALADIASTKEPTLPWMLCRTYTGNHCLFWMLGIVQCRLRVSIGMPLPFSQCAWHWRNDYYWVPWRLCFHSGIRP